jgi:predicted porin
MNKTIKLAVAGAVLSAATIANAGIIIPAGEWTVDLSGNVNTFANFSNTDISTHTVTGGLAFAKTAGAEERDTTFSTGLLPNFLSFAGTTRQNDLDVTWLISINPGGSQSGALSGGSGTEHRQAFLTFGDKSWGTVKVGKDLGLFGSTAILNDITLLGVGGAHVRAGNTTTTLGGIGTGYIYADWRTQIAYTTPNMNGFQLSVSANQPWSPDNNSAATLAAAGVDGLARGDRATPGFESQASYTANVGAGSVKFFAGYMHESQDDMTSSAVTTKTDIDTSAAEVGVTASLGNIGLVAYYYDAEGVGTTAKLSQGIALVGTSLVGRDSDGGYVQATYVIPSGTKLGAAYGVSNLDVANGESKTDNTLVMENNRWTVGAYHPLTKHLNLVAEYNKMEAKSHANGKNESDAISLGAILFF